MTKKILKSLFTVLLINSIFQLKANNNDEIKNDVREGQVEAAVEKTANTQNKLIPLSEQEIQQFKDSCTPEDNALLQQFAQSFSESFEALKSNEIYKQIEKMCADKGFSLQIVLSIIPCKLVSEETLVAEEALIN